MRTAVRAEVLRAQGIEPIICDVLDPAALATLPAVDRLFYSVGFDRAAGAAMRTVYVDGLRHVIEALSARIGRLVYASSTGVYGPGQDDWVDEDAPTGPQHASGQVVLEAEELLRALAPRHRLPFVILRFAGLYGPGRVPGRARLERGEPIVGDPEKPLNLVHVADAAAAAVAALDRGRPGRIYLVSDGSPQPRRSYYARAAALLGAPPPRFTPPAPGSPEALREASSKRVSNRRMIDELGVTLAFPDIDTGLQDALEATR